jgi:hypothetical protein
VKYSDTNAEMVQEGIGATCAGCRNCHHLSDIEFSGIQNVRVTASWKLPPRFQSNAPI